MIKKYKHQIVGIIIFLIIIFFLHSCTNTKLVLGPGHGPQKIEYHKKGDVIIINNTAYIVFNNKKLNYKISFYEQGWRNYSLKRINRYYIKYSKPIIKKK